MNFEYGTCHVFVNINCHEIIYNIITKSWNNDDIMYI